METITIPSLEYSSNKKRCFFKNVIAFIFLCFSTFSYAQQKTITATLVDSETNDPIVFANVGFEKAGIGTISDDDGTFSLTYNESKVSTNVPLTISMIGYGTVYIPYAQLDFYNAIDKQIKMTVSQEQLASVLIKSGKRSFEKLGEYILSDLGEKAYWKDANGLGGELATRISVRKKNTRLEEFKFNILNNASDSILVRFNVYDFQKGAPGNNLLTKNIYHTITTKRGMETIPLKKHNIVVNDDIVVSIELIEVYGDNLYLSISGNHEGGISFSRERSHDYWKVYNSTTLSYSLLTSYTTTSTATDTKRKIPNDITLLWDTSLRMKERDFDAEMKLLKKYFSTVKSKRLNANLSIISWGKHKMEEQSFTLKNTSFKKIETYLANRFYNGSSTTLDLTQKFHKKPDVFLLFSDGRSDIVWPNNLTGITVFTINSFYRANHKNLQDLAKQREGHYINLARNDANESLKYLLEQIPDNSSYNNTINDPNSQLEIYGIVYGKEGPVNGALVKVKGTFKETITDSEGAYRIAASDGETLQIEALNYKQKDTAVAAYKKINIPLEEDSELLEAAVVKQKVEKTEMVNTPFGKRKKNSLGYSTALRFTSDDILPEYVTLGDVLRRMPGVIVSVDIYRNEKYLIRKEQSLSFQNEGTTYPAFILDGMIYDQFTDQVPLIDPQDIEDITVITSKSALIKYGQLAAYGAIIVRTKFQAQLDGDLNNNEQKQESLLVKGNIYDETVATLEQTKLSKVKPNYLAALEKSSSFEEAFKTYQEFAYKNEKDLDFYLNTGTYFIQWHPPFAASVLSNIEEIAPNNIRALRALAYMYESLDLVHEATPVLKKIRELAPKQLQNHLNVARNYVATEKYEAAASLYKQMAVNATEGLDFSPIQNLIINELQQLVWKHKNKITYSDLPEDFMSLKEEKEVRFVFDWTDPLMDFEIQFVGPDNRYYTFAHNTISEPELLEQETTYGFATRDYIMNSVAGDSWLVNIQYKGDNEPTMPRLLKYTVYKDFGLPTEEKEVKVIWIENYTEKVTLDKFTL